PWEKPITRTNRLPLGKAATSPPARPLICWPCSEAAGLTARLAPPQPKRRAAAITAMTVTLSRRIIDRRPPGGTRAITLHIARVIVGPPQPAVKRFSRYPQSTFRYRI